MANPPELLTWLPWQPDKPMESNRVFLAEVQKRGCIQYQVGRSPRFDEEAKFAVVGHYFAYDQNILRYAYIDHILPKGVTS